VRVAACQFSPGKDKAANIAAASRLIGEAAQAGARLAVLPEYTDYLGPREGIPAIAESIPGPTADAFAATARDHGIWVLIGSVHERIAGERRCGNTSLLFSPHGELVAKYRKTHLFDAVIPGRVDARESDLFVPGRSVVTATIEDVRIGMSICYDLRFPELYRLQALQGAKILCVPAAFQLYTGRDHWELLLRARAVENQCFVIGAATLTSDPPTNGRSVVVDPWGVVLATAADRVCVVVADIDLAQQTRIRAGLPALLHRREDVYLLRGPCEMNGEPTGAGHA
jgi:deaminated glutathione amidase